MDDSDFYWMAGLLEGEGSFLAPSPSRANMPRITCSSTDEDVIARLAGLLEQSYHKASQERARRNGWKLAWAVELRGRKAVAMMQRLRPIMSKRRQAQIENALSSYDPLRQSRRWRISSCQADQIRDEINAGLTPKSLALKYGVSVWTIYDVKNRTHRTS